MRGQSAARIAFLYASHGGGQCFAMSDSLDPAVQPPSLSVLYRDNSLIAIDKPPGIPVHATLDPRRDHLQAQVHRWLKAEDPQARAPVLLHRLDVDTTGVVLFALDPKMNQALAEDFAQRSVDKVYLAVAGSSRTHAVKHWTLRSYLKEVRGAEPPVQAVRAGGKTAQTDVMILDENQDFALLLARPRTGRRHQIRVQLADDDLPLLGDRDYGWELARSAPRCMLHAWQLRFIHPQTQELLTIIAPPPADLRASVAQCKLHEAWGEWNWPVVP